MLLYQKSLHHEPVNMCPLVPWQGLYREANLLGRALQAASNGLQERRGPQHWHGRTDHQRQHGRAPHPLLGSATPTPVPCPVQTYAVCSMRDGCPTLSLKKQGTCASVVGSMPGKRCTGLQASVHPSLVLFCMPTHNMCFLCAHNMALQGSVQSI